MQQIKVSLIGTFIFLNLVLLLFLWERSAVNIDTYDVPSIAPVSYPAMKSDIITEKVSSIRKGDYTVEDYASVEVWYDQKGKIIKRVPTGDHTYLRYWEAKKGKVMMDEHDDE